MPAPESVVVVAPTALVDVIVPPAAGPSDQKTGLRRELSRWDTVLFLISAMVVVDTVGAIAIGGGQALTWLLIMFVLFFVPSALITAELGAAIPEEGGVYVWVRRAFGRFAGGLTSLMYWAGRRGGWADPLWWWPCRSTNLHRRVVRDRHVRVRVQFHRAGDRGRPAAAADRQMGAEYRGAEPDRPAGVLHRNRCRLWG